MIGGLREYSMNCRLVSSQTKLFLRTVNIVPNVKLLLTNCVLKLLNGNITLQQNEEVNKLCINCEFMDLKLLVNGQ